MTGVQVGGIYDGPANPPRRGPHAKLLRRDIYASHRTETLFSDALSASGPARSMTGRCRPQELGAGQRCAVIRSPRVRYSPSPDESPPPCPHWWPREVRCQRKELRGKG